MGLVYGSPRQTADVDLTADVPVAEGTADQIEAWLEAALPRAAAALGYAGFITRIHSVKPRPKGRFETADFPGLTMKVRSERREGVKAFVGVDISFNEKLEKIEALELTDGNEILAYGLEDLIAEKYRAILQQVPRRRQRRQDVYDLDLLIAEKDFDDARKRRIFDTFIIKCRSRKIEPTRASLENPEIRRRSEAEWPTMKLELGELPEFETCFERVAAFYQSLPWDTCTGHQAKAST